MTEELPMYPAIPLDTILDDVVPGSPPTTAMEPIETGEVLPNDARREHLHALEILYQNYFLELGRIAFLITRDLQEAEDIVSDVFLRVAEHYDVDNLDDPLAFLRAAIVNRSRSILRHRAVRDKALPKLLQLNYEDKTSETAIGNAEGSIVIQALGQLSIRQRQAIVLRYYADLNERETAAAMGLKLGSVKSHTSRGIEALRRILGPRLQEFK